MLLILRLSLILVCGLAFPAWADIWGKVEYQFARESKVNVTIERHVLATVPGTLVIRRSGESVLRIGLSEGQLRMVTSWLRENYLRELELRNQRKENAACTKGTAGLEIWPGILRVPLCNENMRHQALALRTGNFLERFTNGRALAATTN